MEEGGEYCREAIQEPDYSDSPYIKDLALFIIFRSHVSFGLFGIGSFHFRQQNGMSHTV